MREEQRGGGYWAAVGSNWLLATGPLPYFPHPSRRIVVSNGPPPRIIAAPSPSFRSRMAAQHGCWWWEATAGQHPPRFGHAGEQVQHLPQSAALQILCRRTHLHRLSVWNSGWNTVNAKDSSEDNCEGLHTKHTRCRKWIQRTTLFKPDHTPGDLTPSVSQSEADAKILCGCNAITPADIVARWLLWVDLYLCLMAHDCSTEFAPFHLLLLLLFILSVDSKLTLRNIDWDWASQGWHIACRRRDNLWATADSSWIKHWYLLCKTQTAHLAVWGGLVVSRVSELFVCGIEAVN